jgi:sarcosine oxidase subunit alpha
VDRSRPLNFRFGGRRYTGFTGDTLASALLASGLTVMGRSFKYHRPRGLMAAGVEEPNVLVQLGEGARSTPNVRATEVELYEGLVADPVNCWPSARFDLMGVNNLASRFLPAGFYYKTFMWPNWRLYEGIIRRAAGLGRAARLPDPDRYEQRFAHCDVLVVGAGPAGLAAARAAAATGARVMLVEQDSQLGGALLYEKAQIDGKPADAWVRETTQHLQAYADVRILRRTTALGYFDHNALTLLERLGDEAACAAGAARCRLWNVRAAQVVLATGALERPLVFPGNDRPGVMLAGAVRQYLVRYGVAAGRRAVVFTNNDDAYRTAEALATSGVEVVGIADARSAGGADAGPQSIPVWRGSVIVGTRGRPELRAVQVRDAQGAERWVACDLLAVSGGFNPTVHLFSQSGGRLGYDPVQACFAPAQSVQAERSVGAVAGMFALSDILVAGHEAGLVAANDAGFAANATALPAPGAAPSSQQALSPLWRVEAPGKAFVDFQNDVTVADIALSERENFVSVEHLKRYTTLGMAPDQGKTSNVNALAIMGALTQKGPGETGTTRYRFPFTPTPLAAIAGRARGELFRPIRIMPCDERHVRLGGRFEDFGGWRRPAGYPQPGESHLQTERREARVVRQAAGLFEGSPLGKIEIVGPDAATFLDRLYANTMSTLEVGKVRYGLMLNELGVIIDDGVALRLADDRFLVCTTSGGASRIADWIEEWLQCEWTDLDVVAQPVTTAWGVVTLSGPKAREILAEARPDFEISAAAFPHMTFREGQLGDLPVRILRVSYTGEVSYEINTPTSRTPELWDRLATLGEPHGLRPVGIDAWNLLRTEKGYLHVGADTDGATTPLDVGWARVLKKKTDFIGRRSLDLAEARRADRLQLVGFEPLEPLADIPIGSHAPHPSGRGSEGYVTAAGHSPALGRTVAMGMLQGGSRRMGETVQLRTPRGPCVAKVTAPGAYDPTGARLND